MKTSLPAQLALLGTLLAGAVPAAGAIYRCPGDAGAPRYSQFPCAGDAEVVPQTLQIVEMPPISDAERALLDELERERAEQRAERARARQKAAREASRERQSRTARCQAARAALDALDRQRRKGYSLQEARALDRRETELEAEARANC